MLIYRDVLTQETHSPYQKPCESGHPKHTLQLKSLRRNPTQRIDVSIRIRRAIHLRDLPLLKRIVKNNPKSVQNPDFADNGNTSLHLAAQLGLLDIAVSSTAPSFVYRLSLKKKKKERRGKWEGG